MPRVQLDVEEGQEVQRKKKKEKPLRCFRPWEGGGNRPEESWSREVGPSTLTEEEGTESLATRVREKSAGKGRHGRVSPE